MCRICTVSSISTHKLTKTNPTHTDHIKIIISYISIIFIFISVLNYSVSLSVVQAVSLGFGVELIFLCLVIIFLYDSIILADLTYQSFRIRDLLYNNHRYLGQRV